MNYTQITLSVPEGYEDQIRKLVMDRIEGIISYEINKPTPEKDALVATELNVVQTKQAVIDKAGVIITK